MRTLQEKYNGINEGKFTKDQFLRDARMEQPSLVTHFNGYDDAVKILKNRGMIQEAAKVTSKSYKGLKYEIQYEAPKGYKVVGVGELEKAIGSPKFYKTSEEARDRAESDIKDYLGEKETVKEDYSKIFKESVLKEFGPMAGSGNVRANDLDNLKRDAAKKSERGDTVYIVGGKFGSYKLSKYFEKGNTYAAFYNGMPQIVEGITEASITEAKEYSFTFDYNTDPEDIEYIENLLKRARVNAYAEQGTFDDEMVIKAGDAIELRRARKAIEADGFKINENVNEAKDLSSYKVGDQVKFTNGEIWKVAKPGVKGNKVFLAPSNDVAKKGHISLAIEFSADELKDTVNEARLTNKSLTDYRYKPTNDMDKYPYEQILRGLRVELEGLNILGTPTPEEYTKALGKVLKNLEKDTIFYTNQVAGVKANAKRTDLMIDATPKNEVDKENGLKKAALKEAIKGVIKNILSENTDPDLYDQDEEREERANDHGDYGPVSDFGDYYPEPDEEVYEMYGEEEEEEDDENFSDPFIDGDLEKATDTEADKNMVRKFMTMYETEPSKFKKLHKQAETQAATNKDIKYKHLLSLLNRAKAGALQSLANQDRYQASIEGMDESISLKDIL